MNKPSAGGPAFPHVVPNNTNNEKVDGYGTVIPPHCDALYAGMNLRDYFAAKALVAVITTTSAKVLRESAEEMDRPVTLNAAIAAYEWADAMLKAREA